MKRAFGQPQALHTRQWHRCTGAYAATEACPTASSPAGLTYHHTHTGPMGALIQANKKQLNNFSDLG